ncbi:GntR family transcriptional regulator [Brevifollis gellanilyticus]|uniref:GntR family transcriptional regulator n=1 Tax=Brevifollis gellanilyticus TaxID=748831 RepID=A0A512MG96_9BACT|nr:GntR family transcriptional regulator [Brevifollis gellanilyticus]GEP45755.1 GntR family transcriptional regulator [Brevifollis gellanilyticus]
MPARPRAALPLASANVPTKQRAVYEALRTEILNGALKPGEAIVIDSLAKRFQVSIIPVREALRQLQSERLVEITPHTGVRVTMVDVASLGEIFAMLGALEGISAVQCLPHLAEGNLLELEALLKKMESSAQKGDRAGFEAANREFHLLPCRIGGFTRVEQTLQSLLTEWERLHRSAFPLAQPPDMVAANQDHRAIVNALKNKEAAKLGPLLARHNQTAVEHYQKFAETLK